MAQLRLLLVQIFPLKQMAKKSNEYENQRKCSTPFIKQGRSSGRLVSYSGNGGFSAWFQSQSWRIACIRTWPLTK